MAAKGYFSVKAENNMRGVAIVLKKALCEWVLLFLLLLDGAFSYFLTKFAQYCDLQLPCILCSRLDHVLGKEIPDFYRNLLCSDHRSEISSLVSCQIHGTLADVHGICEECLLSFTKKKDSSQEIYKFLVGKLGMDGLQAQSQRKDVVPGTMNTKLCSCCSKPWRSRPNVQRLLQSKPMGHVLPKPDIPLPSPPRRCLNRRDGLKKPKDRFTVSATPLLLGFPEPDSLSHVGYTEVKITSESESDFPFSDDDDLSYVLHDQNDLRDDRNAPFGSKFLSRKQDSDPFSKKLAQQSRNDGEFEPEVGEKSVSKYDGGIGHLGLKEINWQPNFQQKSSPALPELISLDDIPLSSSNDEEVNLAVSVETPKSKVHVSPRVNASVFSDLPMQNEVFSPRNMAQLPSKALAEKFADVKETGVTGHPSFMKNWHTSETSSPTRKGLQTDQFNNDASPMPNSDRSGYASDRPASYRSLERPARGDVSVVGENVASNTSQTSTPHKRDAVAPSNTLQTSTPRKRDAVAPSNTLQTSTPRKRDTLAPSNTSQTSTPCQRDAVAPSNTSQTSTPRQRDVSSSNKGSVVNGDAVELQTSGTPKFSTSQLRQKSMERARSYESLESVPEIEGESLIDRLKRQVEHDKICISDLSKELEEERNASAIAANQAMAMITKLQEEKAALRLEALQYLRMMEEQAEYDVDALEKANDVIAEKDKEIQDLEAELEYFKLKYPEEFDEDDNGDNGVDHYPDDTETIKLPDSAKNIGDDLS